MKRVVLVNIILVLLIIVASIFGYFYFVKRDITEVLRNFVPVVQDESINFVASLTGEGKGIVKRPNGIALTRDGRLLITDGQNYRVIILDLNGRYIGEFGSYGEKPEQFKLPYSLQIVKNRVYVTDPVLCKIAVYDTVGNLIKVITASDESKIAFGALATDGIRLYATDVQNHQVVVLDLEGKVIRKFGSAGEKNGQLSYPNGIAVNNGKIYVADSNNNRVELFDTDGTFLEAWVGQDKDGNGGLVNPRGMAFDNEGRLLVVNMMSSKVMRLNKAGNMDYQWGKQGSGQLELFMPVGIVIDSTGKIYVADTLNNRISIFSFQ